MLSNVVTLRKSRNSFVPTWKQEINAFYIRNIHEFKELMRLTTESFRKNTVKTTFMAIVRKSTKYFFFEHGNTHEIQGINAFLHRIIENNIRSRQHSWQF